MSNEPASQDPSTTPSEQPQVEVAATTSAPVESVPSESVQPVSAQPAVEAAQDETANAPRVQLNPTVDPDADRAIPSLAAEPATSVLADLPNEAPLAESIRTGDPVEIPRDAPTLDPELDAAVAAAMGPAGNDTVAPPATGAAPVSSAGATATPAEFNPEEVTPGQRLAGKVVSVYGDSVILDLQGRASAAVPVKNFEANKVPAVGVTLALIAESYDAAEGLIRARVSGGNSVSKPQGDWNAVQVDQVVECLVTKTNKGGLEVTVSNLRGFMPAAQVDVGFCANLEKYVGQKLKAVVLEANAGKKNLILSRRKYLETTQEETRAEAWAKLSVGQRIVGKVKTVKDYGAFIDIGGVDGLLHVSEISWNRLGHPKEVLAEGQEVEVQILGMDADKKKINLGMKQLRTSPWLQVMEKYPIDSVVRGKVTKTTDFGAFVELEPGLEGMIHISELDHKRVVRVTDVVQIGKEVDLKVLTIDPNKRRIALSLKKLIAKPEAPKKPSDEDLAPGANAAPYTPKRDRNNLRGGGTGSGGFSFDRPTRK